MLELALEGIPFFSVSDFEMKREGNTYTAQTLELLKEEYPEDKFYFIIGADSLFQLETWYHPEKVMELTSLLVSGREYDRAGRTLDQQISHLKSVYGAHIQAVSYTHLDQRLLQPGRKQVPFVCRREGRIQSAEKWRRDPGPDLQGCCQDQGRGAHLEAFSHRAVWSAHPGRQRAGDLL